MKTTFTAILMFLSGSGIGELILKFKENELKSHLSGGSGVGILFFTIFLTVWAFLIFYRDFKTATSLKEKPIDASEIKLRHLGILGRFQLPTNARVRVVVYGVIWFMGLIAMACNLAA